VRIVELTAYHLCVPLRKPIRHASHTRTESDNVVVACRLEDGTVGFGEGVPRDYVTGETIDSALELLQSADFKQLNVLDRCRDFGAALIAIEQFALPGVPGDDRGCQGNAARCAIELALLDAYARHWKQPLSRATKVLEPELYQPHERVQYSGAITSGRGAKSVVWAWALRMYGFRHIKVKVGIAGYDDVERLRRFRAAVGPRMDLRIDANEAYGPAEVVERIHALGPFDISAVEQPVPHEHVAVLAKVREQVQPEIMLDESLCSMADAVAAVRQKTCDLFNIRISKCGGLLPSLRIAQFARRQGLGYQLGCQIGETALLSAAGRHFAASVRDIRYLEGSYDRRLLNANLGKTDITFGWGGWAPALAGPGLGVEVDEAALERLTVRKELLLG
jgi:L-Ala-D/L-Glu epimerase / N-acetyl-D-glutamate racemase